MCNFVYYRNWKFSKFILQSVWGLPDSFLDRRTKFLESNISVVVMFDIYVCFAKVILWGPKMSIIFPILLTLCSFLVPETVSQILYYFMFFSYILVKWQQKQWKNIVGLLNNVMPRLLVWYHQPGIDNKTSFLENGPKKLWRSRQCFLGCMVYKQISYC